MLKSILIAIVVAVIVWALSFDLFFAYKGTVLSFGIAVGAGIVIGLILRALTPKIGLLILIVAIVTIIGNFVASKMISKEECVVQEPKLKCGSAGVTPNCFIVHKGESFKWITSGIANGKEVTIKKFKKKFLGIPFPAHPLTKDSYTGNNGSPIDAKAQNRSGYFKYTIECPGGDIQDPMIEIPKK